MRGAGHGKSARIWARPGGYDGRLGRELLPWPAGQQLANKVQNHRQLGFRIRWGLGNGHEILEISPGRNGDGATFRVESISSLVRPYLIGAWRQVNKSIEPRFAAGGGRAIIEIDGYIRQPTAIFSGNLSGYAQRVVIEECWQVEKGGFCGNGCSRWHGDYSCCACGC